MNRVRIKLSDKVSVVLVLSSAMLLSACESVNLTEIAGASGAAVLCAAEAKRRKLSDEEAALYAAVCGVAGFAVMRTLENNRKQHATDEAFYAAESERAAEADRQLSEKIDVATAELERDKQRIDELITASNAADDERHELTGLKTSLEKRHADLSVNLKKAEEEREYQNAVLVHMRESQQGDIKQAESQLAKLEQSVGELMALMESHEVQTASIGTYL